MADHGYELVQTGPIWRVLDHHARLPRTCVFSDPQRIVCEAWIHAHGPGTHEGPAPRRQ